MNLPVLLLWLTALVYPLHYGAIQPFSVNEFSSAIVESGHGAELWWYTPQVEIFLPEDAPVKVKGGTNCWPPVYSGVVYVNPSLSPNEHPLTVMHELVHLHNNCHGSEMDAELSALDALAYMGRDADVVYWLTVKIATIEDNPRRLDARILDEYYRRPLEAALYGDLQKFPYLLKSLVRIGVRE